MREKNLGLFTTSQPNDTLISHVCVIFYTRQKVDFHFNRAYLTDEEKEFWIGLVQILDPVHKNSKYCSMQSPVFSRKRAKNQSIPRTRAESMQNGK